MTTKCQDYDKYDNDGPICGPWRTFKGPLGAPRVIKTYYGIKSMILELETSYSILKVLRGVNILALEDSYAILVQV